MAILKRKKKPVKPARGKFIVIDGTDGSGKATQSKMLVDTLVKAGYGVELADFPQYGNRSAGMIEEYLISKKYGQVNPYAASIFYAIDRFDASFRIRRWLEEGKVVVTNRYVTANAGHQGGKIKDRFDRLKYFKWLNNLEYNIFGIPKPDLNIILRVPAETAQKLAKNKWRENKPHMKGKKSDLHEEDLNHLKNAERVYVEIAKLFPNTKLVDCIYRGKLLSPLQVHNKVWELVRRIALKNTLPK